MDAKERQLLLQRADELERKASVSVRPTYKSLWLMRAADIYERAGCPTAAKLTRKLASQALNGNTASTEAEVK